MRPLVSMSFPEDRVVELADMLDHIVVDESIGFRRSTTEHDPYKIIYTSSLYLYSYFKAGGVPEEGPCLFALAMIAKVSTGLDIETRAQVCRFLGSLIEMAAATHTEYDLAPISTVLIALNIISGSLVRDVSTAAAATMRSERLVLTWSQRERESPRTTASQAIAIVKGWMPSMFGPDGDVLRALDRFMSALVKLF